MAPAPTIGPAVNTAARPEELDEEAPPELLEPPPDEDLAVAALAAELADELADETADLADDEAFEAAAEALDSRAPTAVKSVVEPMVDEPETMADVVNGVEEAPELPEPELELEPVVVAELEPPAAAEALEDAEETTLAAPPVGAIPAPEWSRSALVTQHKAREMGGGKLT